MSSFHCLHQYSCRHHTLVTVFENRPRHMQLHRTYSTRSTSSIRMSADCTADSGSCHQPDNCHYTCVNVIGHHRRTVSCTSTIGTTVVWDKHPCYMQFAHKASRLHSDQIRHCKHGNVASNRHHRTLNMSYMLPIRSRMGIQWSHSIELHLHDQHMHHQLDTHAHVIAFPFHKLLSMMTRRPIWTRQDRRVHCTFECFHVFPYSQHLGCHYDTRDFEL